MFGALYRLFAVAFCVDFAVMAGTMGVPFFIYSQLGGGAGTSGWIGGIQAACYAGACLLSASLVSRAKNGLTWAALGIALFSVMGFLIPFSTGVVMCGALAVGSFMSLSLSWPALYAWIGAEPDVAVRGRNIARFNVAWSASFVVSPLLAGPLFDWDYRMPFFMLGTVGVIAFLLTRSLPHENAHYDVAPTPVSTDYSVGDRVSDAHLYASWCANFMTGLLITNTRTVFPKRIDELVNAGELRLLWESTPASFLTSGAATKYSWLAAAIAFTMVMTFIWMGRNRGWHHRFSLLVWVQVFSALAFWMLGRTHSLAVMMICFILVGFGRAVTYFASTDYSIADPALKHRRAAINEGAIGLGGFIGSVGFGHLASVYGTAWPFLYTPILVAAVLIVQVILMRQGIRRQRHGELSSSSDRYNA